MLSVTEWKTVTENNAVGRTIPMPSAADINRWYRLLTSYWSAVIDVEPLWLWLYWTQSPSSGQVRANLRPSLFGARQASVFHRNANRRYRSKSVRYRPGAGRTVCFRCPNWCHCHAVMRHWFAVVGGRRRVPAVKPNSRRTRELIDSLTYRPDDDRRAVSCVYRVSQLSSNVHLYLVAGSGVLRLTTTTHNVHTRLMFAVTIR